MFDITVTLSGDYETRCTHHLNLLVAANKIANELGQSADLEAPNTTNTTVVIHLDGGKYKDFLGKLGQEGYFISKVTHSLTKKVLHKNEPPKMKKSRRKK